MKLKPLLFAVLLITASRVISAPSSADVFAYLKNAGVTNAIDCFSPLPETGKIVMSVAKGIEYWGLSIPKPLDSEILHVDAAQESNIWASVEADADIARRNTPIIYDQPIQARIEIPVAPDHVVRLEADLETGVVIPVEIESIRKTEPEYQAAKTAALTAHQEHRQRIAAIANDLDQVEATMNAIDVTAGGALGLAIADTAGAPKTALTETRKVLVDFKVAVKNLRQACEKLRREVK